MESLADPPSVPHIVQVYPIVTNAKIQPPQVVHISHPSLQSAHSQGKISYQQTITDTISVSEQEENQMQSQIIMSCQQTQLQSQSIQPLTNVSMQSQQVLTSDVSHLQFTSHVILPQLPVYKQHVIVDSQQHYYGQYEIILKDPQCVDKAETENVTSAAIKQLEEKPESIPPNVTGLKSKKKTRNQFPNPNKWACNIRKLKHQRGEAYINRRGLYVPERKIRNTKNCLTSCKFNCNQRISDADRELIFKAFYSLNANEKKHFLLNTTERHNVKNAKTSNNVRRMYTFKYFFLVRAVRYTVCKNFYLGTLAISQKPVYNVHLGKSEMNLPKPDGRGLSANSVHALPSESKERVRRHIGSFKTVDLKQIKFNSRKKQYFGANLTIKQMYNTYLGECSKDNVQPVRESMYRKILRQDFNVHFKKTKVDQICAKCKEPIKDK